MITIPLIAKIRPKTSEPSRPKHWAGSSDRLDHEHWHRVTVGSFVKSRGDHPKRPLSAEVDRVAGTPVRHGSRESGGVSGCAVWAYELEGEAPALASIRQTDGAAAHIRVLLTRHPGKGGIRMICVRGRRSRTTTVSLIVCWAFPKTGQAEIAGVVPKT
jgi:hypothetical protein